MQETPESAWTDALKPGVLGRDEYLINSLGTTEAAKYLGISNPYRNGKLTGVASTAFEEYAHAYAKRVSEALRSEKASTRHHAVKKSSAQLQRDIDEALTTPAWAKGLDLSESRALAKRLGTVDIEAKQRQIESDRRAALPSLAITDTSNGIFVRVSSPGVGYNKYHAVVDALKAFQIPLGNAIPPNIFVPVHKAADKTKVRIEVEEALRYAGYRVPG